MTLFNLTAPAFDITAATNTGTSVTITTTCPVASGAIFVSNVGGSWSSINGIWTITSTGSGTITFTVNVAPTGTYASGTPGLVGANTYQIYSGGTYRVKLAGDGGGGGGGASSATTSSVGSGGGGGGSGATTEFVCWGLSGTVFFYNLGTGGPGGAGGAAANSAGANGVNGRGSSFATFPATGGIATGSAPGGGYGQGCPVAGGLISGGTWGTNSDSSAGDQWTPGYGGDTFTVSLPGTGPVGLNAGGGAGGASSTTGAGGKGGAGGNAGDYTSNPASSAVNGASSTANGGNGANGTALTGGGAGGGGGANAGVGGNGGRGGTGFGFIEGPF